MKRLILKITAFSALLITACSKSNSPTQLAPAANLTVSTNSVTYTIADSLNKAITFDWSLSNAGTQTNVVSGALQLSTDASFAANVIPFAGNLTSLSLTVAQLNSLAAYMNVASTGMLYARVQYEVQKSNGSTAYINSPVKIITVNGVYSSSFGAVTGLSLYAQVPNTNNVLLTWTTIAEYNCTGFILRRSSDGGISWTNISMVMTQAPNGNSSAPLTYTYSDLNLQPNSYIYQIVYLGGSGDVNYSNLTMVLIKVNSGS